MLTQQDIQNIVDAIESSSFIQEMRADIKRNTEMIDALARMTAERFDRVEVRLDRVEERLSSLEIEIRELSHYQNRQDVILERNTDDIRVLKTKFA